MKSTKIAVAGVVAVCALAMSGEVFAAGGQPQRRPGTRPKSGSGCRTVREAAPPPVERERARGR